MIKLTGILTIALGVSALGNAVMVNLYLGQRDEVARISENVKTANASALACSKATDRYREAAQDRAEAAEKRAAVAEALAMSLEGSGDRELSRPAAVPGDACKSAQVETDEWMARRRGTK